MSSITSIEDKIVEFFKQEKYRSIIARSAAQRATSIALDFNDLIIFDEELSHLIVNEPLKYLPLLEKAAWNQLRIEDPEYAVKVKEFKVRIYNLPEVILIRDIRASHLRKLIAIDGLVVRASSVKPIIKTAVFRCRACGAEQTIPQDGQRLVLPESCNSIKCRGRKQKFDLIEEKSEYYDYQMIGVQEKPEDLPPGQLPRSIDVGLRGDLVDKARPGDRVIVTGILYAIQERTAEAPLKTSKMYLEAVSIETASKEPESLQITPEEEKMLKEMARAPDIHQKLIESIAPSIYGLEHIKKAIMLLLFGGRTKQFPDGVRVRGDIHVLLVGDPGTGKSQLLRYAAQIAPRGLYTSGRGSTAAGLTAAVVRDKGGNMILEAGALVLADMGVCCIDEIEKMRPEDRVAIHESMAQQSYHRDFEILTYNCGKIKIGEFVDSLFRKYSDHSVKFDDCEVLEILPEVIIYTINNESLKTDICIPVRVSRHKAPDKFIKITYSNGREIIVTPEHPVYVWREGRIVTIRADEVKIGDFAPAIKFLPNNSSLITLETELLPSEKEKQIKLPHTLSATLARLLGYLTSKGYFYSGRTYEVRFSNKDEMLIKDVQHMCRELFGLNPTVIVSKYGVKTLRYLSKELYDFIKHNFPEIVRKFAERRIPKQILSGSADIAREFLRGLFLSDGSIDSYSITFKTSSKGLAEDYQDLLLKVGVSSSIIRDKKGYYRVRILSDSLERFTRNIIPKNSRLYPKALKLVRRSLNALGSHDVFPPDVGENLIKLMKNVGLNYRGRFDQNLKNYCGITRKTLIKGVREIWNKIKHDVNKIKKVKDLRELRVLIGYSQQRLASCIGLKRSSIDYAERGGYTDEKRRWMLEIAKEKILQIYKETEDKLQELNKLLSSDIRFIRVKKVGIQKKEKEIASEWVYDITVEPTHTFISHGLLLHNTVSIAKGGIVATLNARTSILAAANPELGRYNPYESFTVNVNLPITILSRFDLIFVLRDEPIPEHDQKVATHILSLQSRSTPPIEPVIKPEILRKYIAYAKRVQPELTPRAAKLIENFYLQMRSIYQQTSTIAITARQLESLIRLAEARARAALRDYVTEEDVMDVIDLMKRSLSEVGIDVETGKPDIDVIMTGKPKSIRDKFSIVLKIIGEIQDKKGYVEDAELREALREYGIEDQEIKMILNRLLSDGKLFTPRPGIYRLT